MAIPERYGYVCRDGGGGTLLHTAVYMSRPKVAPPFHTWLPRRSAVNKQPSDREREWGITQEDFVGLKLCLYLPFTFH